MSTDEASYYRLMYVEIFNHGDFSCCVSALNWLHKNQNYYWEKVRPLPDKANNLFV